MVVHLYESNMELFSSSLSSYEYIWTLWLRTNRQNIRTKYFKLYLGGFVVDISIYHILLSLKLAILSQMESAHSAVLILVTPISHIRPCRQKFPFPNYLLFRLLHLVRRLRTSRTFSTLFACFYIEFVLICLLFIFLSLCHFNSSYVVVISSTLFLCCVSFSSVFLWH